MDWVKPLQAVDKRWKVISPDGSVKVLGTLDELKTPRLLALDKLRKRLQLDSVALTALKHRGDEWK